MKKTGSLILSLLLSVSLLLSGGVLRVEAQEADASLTQTATTEKKENGASEIIRRKPQRKRRIQPKKRQNRPRRLKQPRHQSRLKLRSRLKHPYFFGHLLR